MESDKSKMLAAELSRNMPEFDLHGLKPEEARNRVDQFLYENYKNAEIDSVRIIFGIGKGIMKKTTLEFLTDHPLVSGIKEEPGSCIVVFDKG